MEVCMAVVLEGKNLAHACVVLKAVDLFVFVVAQNADWCTISLFFFDVALSYSVLVLFPLTTPSLWE